ncbi:MAG: hypothetical protein HOV81_22985 [Kofleriaceae bacterium]|nr:hypothetical protein [Kofleriaceae bacterium]
MTKRTWYRVALARPGVVRLVASSGEHMGQAIAEAVDHIAGSWPVAVDNAPEEIIPLGESVGKGHVIMLGDAPPDLPTFRWPTGVLPSLEGAPALAAARPGWIVRPDRKLLVIEAQTDEEHIIDLFLGLIEKLPSADNLEVRVQPHFEDAPATHVWLTSRVNAKKILRFLDDHDVELIGNGHLELSVYVRAHKATLRLTEHKTVVWIAEDGALEADVERWLGELGVPRVDSLTTIAEAPHFHYRPAKSRDRKKLEEELYRQRLRKVATEPKA